MHPEWVDITRVVAVIAVAVVVRISTVVWTFGSLLFRCLLPIEEVIVIPFGGYPRAQAAVIGVVTPP
jgi:hypothetical protein